MILNGDPLFSRRCVDGPGARYVAEALRQDQDYVRGGWSG